LEPELAGLDDQPQLPYVWYWDHGAYPGGTGFARPVHLGEFSMQWERMGADFKFMTYVDVPDTDGDGLANDVDQYRYEPGLESNNGCPDTVAPTGSVLINGGAASTTSRAVRLHLSATDPNSSVAYMRFRNVAADTTWSAWKPYTGISSWTLTPGEGTKKVAVQFKDADGNRSETVYDNIVFRR
jgi:hypothetical protein